MQYILQTRHVILTSFPLAVLPSSINRTTGFRKFGLFYPSATNLPNKPEKPFSMSVSPAMIALKVLDPQRRGLIQVL